MVGTRKKSKVGVKRRVTEQQDEKTTHVYLERKAFGINSGQAKEMFTPPVTQTQSARNASQSTAKIIRILDDSETFTRISSHGETLTRRFVEKETVDTPTEQLTKCTQLSGRNLSPILRSVDLDNMEIVDTPREQHNDSQVGADFRNSLLKVSEAPTPMHIPLCQELRFTDTDSDSLLHALSGNLPDMGKGALLLCASQGGDGMVPENNSADAHHSHPTTVLSNSVEKRLEDKGSSSTNKGSKMTANTNKPSHSQSFSFNTIHIIEEMGKSDLAGSLGASNGLVSVKDYKVKSPYAGLLTSIISKHGDIGADCSMVSVTIRSMCMEHVCDIVESLKKTTLKFISDEELKTMMALVADLENERVNISWLRKRLEEISEAKKAVPQLKHSSSMTQLHTERLSKVQCLKEQLEGYKRAVFDLQKKICSTMSDLAEAETEVLDSEKMMSEIKTNLKHVYKLDSLADGLV